MNETENKTNEEAELKNMYPTFAIVEGYNNVVVAAKNIRKEIKKAFSGFKFRVNSKKYSGGSSINVYYSENFESVDELKSIIGKYEQGWFDGMTDCYNYNMSLFNSLFGSTKFVFVEKEWK